MDSIVSKNDLVQWMIDANRKKSPQMDIRLTQHAMGLLFGAAHQTPMFISFALYNLCKYPEYLEALRAEIQSLDSKNLASLERYDKMVLLESFLKETARLNPMTAMTLWRKVLSPFTFSDGTVVQTGNWICMPQQAITLDKEYYPEPLEFKGFRLVKEEKTMCAGSRLTTATFEFPFWGGTRHPCYAIVPNPRIKLLIKERQEKV
ncbi:MAG: hypothetical protein LQ340_001833 [Diploschistes diacapsis]|nr:MAG: hypothetical protein LQ340_001833 [Diploschistes diacapsis]